MEYFLKKFLGQEKYENMLERRKYLSSPIAYKIIYDKYNRKNIYEQIKKNKVLKINSNKNENKNENENENENEILDSNCINSGITGIELKNIIKKDFKKLKEEIPECATFSEVLVYSLYNQLFTEKILIANFIVVNLLQFAFYKYLKNVNFDNRQFIFLDNNRAIFNKVITANIILLKLIKGSLILSSFIIGYFIFDYLKKRHFLNLEEEKLVLNSFQRTFCLYSKII